MPTLYYKAREWDAQAKTMEKACFYVQYPESILQNVPVHAKLHCVYRVTTTIRSKRDVCLSEPLPSMQMHYKHLSSVQFQ